jgi:cytochrome P450
MDFDHHSPAYRHRWEEMADALHRRDYPVAWSEHYGGFWVIGSWEGIHRIAADWEAFSSDNDPEGERAGSKGVVIPSTPYPLMLTESDPSLSTGRRMVEASFFLPRALRGWEQVARDFLDETLDQIDPHATVDFANETVIPTTARTTLGVLGFDRDHWQDAALSARRSSYTKPGSRLSPSRDDATARGIPAHARRPAGATVRRSRLGPGSWQGAGARAERRGSESMISAMVFGGFDTTTALTLNTLIWLDTHRDEHERLRTDPAYLQNAIEEILRLYPSTGGFARNVMRDVELAGRGCARAGASISGWPPGIVISANSTLLARCDRDEAMRRTISPSVRARIAARARRSPSSKRGSWSRPSCRAFPTIGSITTRSSATPPMDQSWDFRALRSA